VIISALRTPVGDFGGVFKSLSATELGKVAISSVILRSAIDERLVDEVIMGNVLQAGLGQNPARIAALKAGLPQSVPALTINQVCGSGLMVVIMAAQNILLGEADIVIAGGMESMSNAPYLIHSARWGYRLGDASMVDLLLKDGLCDGIYNHHMGLITERLARKYKISREEQDELALESHMKYKKAYVCILA